MFMSCLAGKWRDGHRDNIFKIPGTTMSASQGTKHEIKFNTSYTGKSSA